MARAVYHDADIYLLDDPLAAVDALVGQHIFQKCIVDELLLRNSSKVASKKKSSVILVTNAIQYLSNKRVSKIVVFDGGSIAEVGTYSELIAKPDSLFTSFVSVLDDANSQEVHGSIEDINEDLVLNSCDVLEDNMEKDQHELKRSLVESSIEHVSPSTTPLMTNEFQEREKGHVNSAIYFAWAKAAGGPCIGICLILGYIIDQGVLMTSKWYVLHVLVILDASTPFQCDQLFFSS